MHAIYMIADEELADLAGASALQMTLHWDCDFHIFIERRDPAASIREVGDGRITYHYDELSGFLPDDLPEFDRWPRIVYLRLFAPLVLSNYKRLLYLDADILALGSDPAIWDIPLPHGLGAVADLAMLNEGPGGMDRDDWLAGIGVSSGRYANSGVLLIDPVIWNRIDFAALLPPYFANHPAVMFQDQDFLAHVFDGLWTELSPRFNWQGGVLHWGLTCAVSPIFVHFCMIVRPWHGVQAPWLSPNDPAYVDMYAPILRHAGICPGRYQKTFRLPALRRAKYALWGWLNRHGVSVPREEKRRVEWFKNHASLCEYINQGLSEGRFEADPRKSLCLSEPKLFWDGRFVRVADDLPPGDPLKPAHALASKTG